MKHRVTRRRFGQVAIASTAVTAIAVLTSNKTFSQTSPVFVGVLPGPINNTDEAALTLVDSPNPDNSDDVAPETDSPARSLVLQSLNVVTGLFQPLNTFEALQNGATPILQSGDQITGLTTLLDGTFVVAITPSGTSKNGNNPTRLTFLGTSPRSVTVSGLKPQEQLESLVVINDGSGTGSLLGLVLHRNGKPPMKLVNINVQTGEITSSNRVILPANQQFSNLAQCPDGKLYTTSVGRIGESSLVELNLQQKQPTNSKELRFNDQVWLGGLSSLVCSPAGELFGLGARWHESPKYLHSIDVKTGNMTRLNEFEVAMMTLAGA